ncbi:CLUMA_CG006091, isoform A [Clunio marinus]|uniref:CLUMA_CG006091, isoform A n=1 Tax=Clunio marinus TaxID=568069 RepID=A0A1J1HWU5_9DIPT|nr:CLUMA_CG006091, isoform A [Clunio marinus]
MLKALKIFQLLLFSKFNCIFIPFNPNIIWFEATSFKATYLANVLMCLRQTSNRLQLPRSLLGNKRSRKIPKQRSKLAAKLILIGAIDKVATCHRLLHSVTVKAKDRRLRVELDANCEDLNA